MYLKKRTAVLLATYLCAALIALAAWGRTEARRAEQSEMLAQAGYERAFGELVTSLTDLDYALQKSLYATSPTVSGALCTQAFSKAMAAQMALGVLPFSTQELEQTAGFISRVGDYAFMLSRSAVSGEGYTGQQRENLAALSETAGVLAQNMRELRAELADGVLLLDEMQNAEQRMDEAGESMPQTLSGAMLLVEQEFPEVPSLIYDGPFSAHLDRAEPIFLQEKASFSEQEALAEAREILEGGKSVHTAGHTDCRISTWDFTAMCGDGESYISISKQGGKPVSMLCSRSIGEAKLSDDEALECAQRYLEKHGFSDMRSTYHMKQGGMMTINFAATQEGVLLYPDLVKVSVALDDGSIIGLETRGYLMNHRTRTLPQAEISVEEAKSKVADGLEILGHKLCVIPREGGQEVFCHEFVCQTERGEHYIVYVDAVSGEQEKILILLEDETGAQTI